MKIILLKEVKGRGGEGDVIDVKDGFANNYLLRQGFAVKATKGNLKQLEERRANIAKREETRIAEAKEIQEKIDNLKFKVDVQIGDEGQLFGAVTSQMIVDGIKKNTEVEIDKRRVDVRKAIKTVGLHKAEVTIYRDIKANLNVVVGGEDPEKFMENLKKKKKKKLYSKSNKKHSNKQKKDKEQKENQSDDSKQAAATENTDETVSQPNNAENANVQVETAVENDS